MNDTFTQLLCAKIDRKNIKTVFLFNCGIALLFGVIGLGADTKAWWREFVYSFIFAQCIGFSIFFLTAKANLEAIASRWLRFLVLGILFALGGLFGGLVALGFLAFLFHRQFSFENLSGYLGWLVFLALLFGSAGYAYFTLKDKFRQAVGRLAEKEVAEQRLLRLKTKAELEALRAKVNPHFLFNTLNSIASLIPMEPDKAEEMVQRLSGLLRYTLETSSRESMKLAEELEVVQDYLAIEKIRLGDRLTYAVQMEEELAEVRIPGLVLQPLVENSVKHGIAPLKNGGHVTVTCKKVGDRCRIEIRDTGRGFDPQHNGSGFGLSGVRERLALFYQDDYDFQIAAASGVTITLTLPLKRKARRSRKGRPSNLKPKRDEIQNASGG
ncbi:MAG: hypothetical protein D6743_06390 [Calditrichaeota bacterium]|nr:MAG: hypothetical protein D6743_06390 [Calditrichota bacterium]